MSETRAAFGWKRVGLIGDGLFFLVLAAVFLVQLPQSRLLWRWQDESLTAAFLGALLAAYAAGSLTAAKLSDDRAAISGALGLVVGLGGFAATVGVEELLGARRGLGTHAAALAVLALLALGTLISAVRSSAADEARTTMLLRAAFAAFAFACAAEGVALLTNVPDVLPWIAGPRTTLLFGWLSIGVACAFAHAAWSGRRAAARVLLAGTLAYGVTISLPLLRAFETVSAEHQAGLIAATAGAAVSSIVALSYLLIDGTVRLVRST